jgi:hypothetical protein
MDIRRPDSRRVIGIFLAELEDCVVQGLWGICSRSAGEQLVESVADIRREIVDDGPESGYDTSEASQLHGRNEMYRLVGEPDARIRASTSG